MAEFFVSLGAHGVRLVAPTDASFADLCSSYAPPAADAPPAVVALPDSPAQVQTLVRACLAAGRPVAVRGGGHDMYRRHTRPGAVLIDLRALRSVAVAPDQTTATVGAGLTSEQLLAVLEPRGLQAVTGTGAAVGFTAWSLGGGYGPLDARYGIGAHQIVAAKVVNGQGRLLQADDRLLKAIRGGAGFFGIVVELTVKVYPLDGIQSGVFLFESSDLEKTVTTVLTAYNQLAGDGLPSNFCVLPIIMPFPNAGVILALSTVWSGAASEESRAWADKVGAFAPRLPGPPVQATTMLGMLRSLTKMMRPHVRGHWHSASLTHLSPQAIRVLAAQAAKIPAAGNGGFALHIVRADSPSCAGTAPASVTPYGTPHVSVDILGIVDIAGEDEVEQAMVSWAEEARDALARVDAAADFTYLPFTHPSHLNLQGIFGDNLEFMRQIKTEQDPNNVFNNGLVRL
ncbi:D-lactate dehydrogenase [Cordyceps militaris]|uniref:D-lactate dehydrogenase n=1 Tax=Cordyceps militaris TaxID=73501 RepID=A0A2H4SW69_CORMI|nr:D-lactate dehydrogenase [Cordyceps militaris]